PRGQQLGQGDLVRVRAGEREPLRQQLGHRLGNRGEGAAVHHRRVVVDQVQVDVAVDVGQPGTVPLGDDYRVRRVAGNRPGLAPGAHPPRGLERGGRARCALTVGAAQPIVRIGRQADDVLGGPHQPRSRHSPRCGRSVPSVVSLPCPGYTQVASGSWPNRRSVTSVSSEVKSSGEFVLPTPPGNSESPVNTCGESASRPAESYSTARLPGVCPRRWIRDTVQSPKVSTSPSWAGRPTGTGSPPASAGWATTSAPVCL